EGAALAQLHALLERAEALFEWQVAALEPLDERAQPAQQVLEALGRRRVWRDPGRRCRHASLLRLPAPLFNLASLLRCASSPMAIETPPPELGAPCPDFRLPAVDGR